MSRWRGTTAIVAPLVIGLLLLALMLAHTDLGAIGELLRRVGVVLPFALLPSAVWHLLRTAAWQQCFPPHRRLSFARAFRVRLAAEAFSFVTISGLAGDPLKVVLLHREIPAATAAAATALERILYLVTTMAIVGVAAACAVVMLPLSKTWMLVYSAVAIGPAVCAVFAAVWLRRRRARTASEPPQELPTIRGRVRRFLRELDVDLRETARRHPRRIVTAAGLEAAAYAAMVAEVWLAMKLIAMPVSGTAALAVETFTRVTSMATVFVPANIGVLEATNVAAATAIHAALAGGVALALVRRIRGLVWCAAGFAVYPRRRRQIGDGSTGPAAHGMHTSSNDPRLPIAIVLDDADAGVVPTDRLGGLPLGERIARAAARAGYRTLLVWSPRRSELWRRAARRVASRILTSAESDRLAWHRALATISREPMLTVIGPGIVAAPAVLSSARASDVACSDPVRETHADGRPCGVFRVASSALDAPDALAAVLRNRAAAPPITFSVTTRAELADAERRLRASIFKPTDGGLASFNRRLSIPTSVMAIRLMRLHAHVMSTLIIGLGLWAGWLFARGDYLSGVIGAIVSWGASVLDGCDGELARLQYTESALGCWVDTIGDYTYYLAIFAGLTVGSVRATGWVGFRWIGAALALGLLLTFALLILLRGRITAGRPEQLNANTKAHFYGSGKRWAWLVAKLSNCATRATMPYGIAVLAVVHALPAVLVLGAVGAHIYWISLAVELRRLLASARPAHADYRQRALSPAD